ncbi:MAG: dTDP-4-dehydrorhamnose reductase [Alphaproteobacteria bacterium]|nr:dTDP-4-dehydrorhamnose reductase [Alphaproteobacteria bacterium]
MTAPPARTLVVFGAGGQVGREVAVGAADAGWRAVGYDRAAVDIARADDVMRALETTPASVVVNAASYTAVDAAETDAASALAINADGARNVAAAAARRGAAVIHLSTDYVFDGRKRAPYVEDDPVAPLGVYGRSKEAGDRAVRAEAARHVILRTAAVFAAHGKNFARTMVRLAAERPELRVVDDQTTAPTAADDIAAAILALATRITAPGVAPEAFGTFHYCGRPATTWHGFATAIIAAAGRLGHRAPPVAAIASHEFPTAAARPRYSVLDCGHLARVHGIEQPDWRPALERILPHLLPATQPSDLAQGAPR